MKVSQKGKYYGSKDVERSFNEVVLSQYDYTIETTPWHYHENPYFMFVLQGNMLDCNKKVTSRLPAGSLMFNNWQEQHFGVRHSSEAAGFHLEFERSWFARQGIDLDVFEGSQKIEDPHLQLLMSKMYAEFMFADVHSEISVDVLLAQICDALSSKHRADSRGVPGWVPKLKAMLREGDGPFTLQLLSHELGVHPVHISRAAPKYLSASLGEYIRKVKLNKAMKLLLNTEKNLGQIAHEAGFSDQSHFNHVFKWYFQMRPAAFRKNLRKVTQG